MIFVKIEKIWESYSAFGNTSDGWFHFLNGSTQVNSTEINAMPVPDLEYIQEMRKRLMKSQDYLENNCNMILEEYYE